MKQKSSEISDRLRTLPSQTNASSQAEPIQMPTNRYFIKHAKRPDFVIQSVFLFHYITNRPRLQCKPSSNYH
jgi:30S ribosomal protein S10P